MPVVKMFGISPRTALDLRGKVILRHSDFLSEEQLRRQTFRTSSLVTVRMLLPPTFEDKGKG